MVLKCTDNLGSSMMYRNSTLLQYYSSFVLSAQFETHKKVDSVRLF